jgi:hypothetical protein
MNRTGLKIGIGFRLRRGGPRLPQINTERFNKAPPLLITKQKPRLTY